MQQKPCSNPPSKVRRSSISSISESLLEVLFRWSLVPASLERYKRSDTFLTALARSSCSSILVMLASDLAIFLDTTQSYFRFSERLAPMQYYHR